MSGQLKIDSLLAGTAIEKTAEEIQMEKNAGILQAIENGTTLSAIGENLYKFAAEDTDLEAIKAVGEDLFNLGARIGAATTKLASEDGLALADGLQIAEDLHKVATVLAEIADGAESDDLKSDAAEVIKIANIFIDEANEVYEALEKQAEEEKLAAEKKAQEEKLAAEKKAAALTTPEAKVMTAIDALKKKAKPAPGDAMVRTNG